MIAKLALADVVTNLRVWTGVLVVTAVTAFVGALTAGIVESGIRHGGLVRWRSTRSPASSVSSCWWRPGSCSARSRA